MGRTQPQALHDHDRPSGTLTWGGKGGPETGGLGLCSWIGRLGLHVMEQGFMEERALELEDE